MCRRTARDSASHPELKNLYTELESISGATNVKQLLEATCHAAGCTTVGKHPDRLLPGPERGFISAGPETQEIQHFEAPGLHTTDHWFDFSVYPSADGISIYWRDITERKNLEEELKRSK